MASDLDRVQDLFLAALELPEAERGAYLDAACETDDEYRAVRDLLDADALESPFLLDEPLVRLTAEVSEEVEGRQVGPYRIRRLLGRGGMGAVYLAEREDVGRDVALKVVRGDLADPSARRRFLSERRILGRLEHPSIARLYDVGVAEDGTPYFAMEHVEGVPVTEYCDQRQLGLEARLRMFEAIGRAVQHAHQHFIVHRDLKPSNIYVTPEGEIKLLDFGIAKALDEAENALEDGAHTVTGRRLLTPAYAAPEQHTDAPVTAASDVYSLGVVLFELLTGTRPDTATATGTAPKRPSTVVTESDATRSTAAATRKTTVDRLARRLRGDLDVICLKALQPEPERRYASAEAFVEDIKRHLDGRPVMARPDSAAYRFQKFIRRHRRGVWASVAGALVLAGIVGFYTVRLQAERDRARTEGNKAEEVKDFMLTLFEASNPSEAQGDTLTALQLLERGQRRAAELAVQPEVQAEMFEAIAESYLSLRRYEDAEHTARRALDVRRSLFGESHEEVAESLTDLGRVLTGKGDFDEADRVLRRAVEVRRQVLSAEDPAVAETLAALALLRNEQGAYEAADSLLRDALRLRIAAFGSDHIQVAETTHLLGRVAFNQGAYEQALEQYQESLRVMQAVLPPSHPQLASALTSIARTFWAQGDFGQARASFLDVLAFQRRTLGARHPDIATTLMNLGIVQSEEGDPASGIASIRSGLELASDVLGTRHPSTLSIQMNLATTLHRQERYAEAGREYREVLRRRREVYGDVHRLVISTQLNLASLHLSMGELEEAERRFRDGIASQRQLLGADHPNVGVTLRNFASLLRTKGEHAASEATSREAASILRAALGDEHPDLALTLHGLGGLYAETGEYAKAERALNESYAIFAAALDAGHPDIDMSRRANADLYRAWGKPEEAARFRPPP